MSYCSRCGQERDAAHEAKGCEPVLVDGAVYSEEDGSFVSDPKEAEDKPKPKDEGSLW